MGEAIRDEVTAVPHPARALARLVEPFHSVTYYAPEIGVFADHGFKGWWHAYFAYRPAPMGAVNPALVTAAFYNFAPRMVERALPDVWRIASPAEVIDLRLEAVDRAMRRIYDGAADQAMREADTLVRRATADLDTVGRPIFGPYAALDWPEPPHLSLWHGCTLLREYRGDGHHIALAAAAVDGIECHVLMAALGHGNRPTIVGIRGWSDDEWRAAHLRLAEQGWLTDDGELTAAGREARYEIEQRTDELASAPIDALGPTSTERLIELLTPLVDHLAETGVVAGTWPPPGVFKPDE